MHCCCRTAGNFFSEDGQTLTTDSAVGQQAFQEWIDFYLEYSFPLNKNEYNRFRTGEMPLAVTSYTLYNQLTAAAPDIRGLWEMLPIPGVRQADGTIDRAEVAGGTACVMLGSSDHKADAWTFMKWWVSADTQAEYGRGVEMALGEAARYTPANQEALERLGWTGRQRARSSVSSGTVWWTCRRCPAAIISPATWITPSGRVCINTATRGRCSITGHTKPIKR